MSNLFKTFLTAFASEVDSFLNLWSIIKNLASKSFLIEYIFAKKDKAKLSAPPDTAIAKFFYI